MPESGQPDSGIVAAAGGRSLERRARILLVFGAACLLGLIGRLCYIHASLAAPGTRLGNYLAQQQRMTLPLSARRGEILDVEGRVLAGSQDRPSFFADPSLFDDPDVVEFVVPKVAAVLGMHPGDITRLLIEGIAANPPKRFVWLKRWGDEEQANSIRTLLEQTWKFEKKRLDKFKIAGIGILREPYRRYPMHTLAAHVVGCVDIDSNGVDGIEARYNKVLAGTAGWVTLYRDVAHRPLWPEEGSEAMTPPRDGMSVKLTLDAAIQEALQAQLAATVEHFRAESGVGIVMNPKTGDVLAMASEPTYDPNRPGDSPLDARRNRVLTDPAEPGSTFKPFVAAAALAEKVVRPGETIYCHNGACAFGGRILHDAHAHDYLTFEGIVIKSSNIGMAILGQRLGNERMHRYLSSPFGFGFGTKTGIELDGEDDGILRPLRQWTSFSTTSIPMGQEVAVTPLQLATAFCSLVNGGQVIRPRIVRAILDARGRVVQEFKGPQVLRQAVPRDVADFIAKTVLVGVVNEGTGQQARLPHYQVLGKTGTAQIARPGGGGFIRDAYTASFIGAAPAADPAIVALVMIRRPDRNRGHFGSTVAAPAVRDVLGHALAYLNVPPDKAPEEEPALKAGRRAVVKKLAPEW